MIRGALVLTTGFALGTIFGGAVGGVIGYVIGRVEEEGELDIKIKDDGNTMDIQVETPGPSNQTDNQTEGDPQSHE